MSDVDHAELNRQLRHAMRPSDEKFWTEADWDAHADSLRARADALRASGPRPPADAFDARPASGADEPLPIDPNRWLRAHVRASRREPLPEDFLD
jgi:hypothetical protein